MGLDHWVAAVETAVSETELGILLQKVAESYGFASYAFVDVSLAGHDRPFVVMTNRADWDQTYRDERFLDADPVISAVRRSNLPFTWSRVPLPERRGKRVPLPMKVMQAAADHGYVDGLVIPFHYVDRQGRQFSSVCTFFWTQKRETIGGAGRQVEHELHLILIYWAQRILDLSAKAAGRPARFLDHDGVPLARVHLTDRERDVLTWAARGKTASETADILVVNEDTVHKHLQRAAEKLGAPTKTAAAARALHLGLIDL